MQHTIEKQTTPLCFMPDGRLVCYKRGKVQIMNNEEVISEFPFPISRVERFFGWNRYVFRILRLGIRSAFPLDNDRVVLSIKNTLYELNISNGALSQGWFCGSGIRPLLFTEIEKVKGFDDGVYFGGYLVNMDKKPVNIYKRIGIDKWEVVYTYDKGAINHVHNVVSDPYRDCVWIFTGDFEDSAAIWKATNGFKTVERVVCNDQKYRGCVAYALPEGLLYATDAPFADDFIYLMNPETQEVKEIYPMHGSCIYGCKWKDSYVFSSTVEGDGRDESFLEGLFSRKRGAGIKDEYVHLYMGNIEKGFKEIYKEKKDIMPFSFQFGVFKFPAGENSGDTLYFQPVATSKNDLRMMSFK